MFEINSVGKKRDGYVKREAYRGLIFGPIFSVLMIFLTYLSMSKWIAFFYVTSSFLVILMFFGFVYSPILMLQRHNRTVCSINVNKETVTIKTFQALWMKSKVFAWKKENLKIKLSKFNWYGKETKEGIILKTKDNMGYYLVKDYFIDYDEIKNKLFTL
ncbi:hypothetical protein LA303_04290 [Candidatus Sulfidibacterium hydrothermale]|uniref:hypothetical protein n=1 Tax=Candidatus Sulfidibacterium hydrothermale TaxID=2875962 RepID=UPI001F0B3DF9|nr:hypothetical protein [Candidatus Sulfidibacterium hydrothermale]UBM63195.1 hypothetical protein LA303_04290 [Candidatus Sulfidibacterium hydrothermale]